MNKLNIVHKSSFLFFLIVIVAVSACSSGSEGSPQNTPDPESGNDKNLAVTETLPELTWVPTETSTPLPDEIESTAVPTAPYQGPPAPEFPVWGIEMHAINKDNGLAEVVDANAYWIRLNGLMWSDVEPWEGARRWENLARLEQDMINASKAGLELIMIVRRTPAWAQANPGMFCGPIASDKIDAFASFMHDVVARYSAPPYNVKYWEIWNEPDIDTRGMDPDSVFGCWGNWNKDYYDGGYYAQVLKRVYQKIKIANPEAQLLVGGLLLDCDPLNPPVLEDGSTISCKSATYLEGILANGGGNYFDGVSFHAYDFYQGELGAYGHAGWNSASNVTGPVFINKSRYLRFLLTNYGFPEKYLLNTENALICGSDGSEPYCQTEEFELTKAYYAAQAYASALAEGLQANIWYSITGWRASGLLDENNEPNPVIEAFRFSAEELGGAGFIGKFSQSSGVNGYKFFKDGKRIWLLWSLDGEEHTLSLPERPSAVYDVFGNKVMKSGEDLEEITVNIEPVYIEFGP